MRSQIRLCVVTGALLLLIAACGGTSANVTAGAMPEGGDWSGVYFSTQYGEMNMIQNGSAIVGEYKQEMRSGKLQGEAEGDLFRFEWVEKKAMVSNRAQETRGHGYFRYQIDPGNGQHVIVGEWGLGDDETGGGPWRAYKMKGKEPKLAGEGETSGGESSADESLDSESGGSDESASDEELF